MIIRWIKDKKRIGTYLNLADHQMICQATDGNWYLLDRNQNIINVFTTLRDAKKGD